MDMLLINSAPFENRVALIENGIITEYYVERIKDRGLVGNIYKGKVLRVLPGMQAAFIDIGLDRAAFLYVADVLTDLSGFEIDQSDHDIDFIVDKKAYAEEKASIEDLLREGQEIIVQVAKGPIGTKGARLTSRITLPGRNIVLMPTLSHTGISRRIGSDLERKKLREIISKLKPKHCGIIVRTAAEGASKEKLKFDLDFLVNLWNEVLNKSNSVSAPSLLNDDLDLIKRAVRDMFTQGLDRLIVDNHKEFENILQFVKQFMPRFSDKIEFYDSDEPLFEAYGIEMEIARAFDRKIWLKSGGYIVIEQTEALTAIDVNTGKYVGRTNLEETITKTNLEAVKEVVYQLRLRNIGGLIIIDFIDMERASNRDKVHHSLEHAVKRDKAKCNVLRFSDLGLVEMTRKRVNESLIQMLSESCPYCEGNGRIKSKSTVCFEILREIKKEAAMTSSKKIEVKTHPAMREFIYDEGQDEITEIEKNYSKEINVISQESFHLEDYEVNVT